MKTRVGKIAQLPREIRDELNQRLQNGKLGPELLPWLNALPETKTLLTEKFDDLPISKQNLSEWRQGGYEEWLRRQERELRVQRIAEEGASLKHCEDTNAGDVFENSARIALAELMADMDSLHDLEGDARFKRLRTLTWELSRLQNAHNRNRWAALAWAKWIERFLGPEDYETDQTETNTSEADTSGTPGSPQISAPPSASAPAEQDAVKPNQTKSTEGEVDDRVYLTRPIHYRKGCGCVCRNCHPDNGEYPYAEALKDSAEVKQRNVQAFWRGKTMINTQPTECDCPCAECRLANIPDIRRLNP